MTPPRIAPRLGLLFLVGTAVLIVENLSTKITPMVDDRDIWRAADRLLKRLRADAEIAAAMRADEFARPRL